MVTKKEKAALSNEELERVENLERARRMDILSNISLALSIGAILLLIIHHVILR